MRRTVLVIIASVVVLTLSVVKAQDVPQDPQTSGQSAQQGRESIGSELDRIVRGYRVNPVRLNLNGKDRALVGLGSYLVNATGGCNDCHTNPPFAPGGDPFLGEPKQVNADNFLAGGTTFGPFTSRNLTPRLGTGRPAGLTFEQFRRTMRTGEDLKNVHPQISPLLQVMPWPVFQSMTDRDLRAIYEYLRAIPHAEPGP